jgi:hypothetical protein
VNGGLVLVILAALGVWFFVLRTRATRLDSKSQFDKLITGGQVVIVDFFSNT